MNLAQKLAEELVRVTALRCRYESLRSIPQANPEFAIALMTAAIQKGVAAAGVNDAMTQMDAVKELQTFTD